MKKIEIFENERATGYDQFVEKWIPNYHYFMDHLPNLLIETNPKELLVVGCGTGNEILRFARSPVDWRITGIDPSPDMIVHAREKLKDYNNIELIEGLITDLSADKKYNAATLLLVLHFIENERLSELLQEAGFEKPLRFFQSSIYMGWITQKREC